MYLFRWFFGKIKRIEAEKKLLLPDNEHGAFLVRDSESRRNDYSLSGKRNILLFFLLFDKCCKTHESGKQKSTIGRKSVM